MKADVAILGGGLAGLTLSLQLRQRFPDLDILVLERRRHPVPGGGAQGRRILGRNRGATTSTPCSGSRITCVSEQLKKFGFRFFFSEGRRDIDGVLELGASTYFTTPTYQIDRGIFENFLGEHARDAGVRFIDGDHCPRGRTWRQDEAAHSVRCELDGAAGGGAGPLAGRRVRPRRAAQARARARAGQRPRREQRVVPDRCEDRCRRVVHRPAVARRAAIRRIAGSRRTTSCGEGYWVWLIPLASGSHSVGIVADARIHPLRAHEHLRSRARLASRVPAPPGRGHRVEARAAAGLRVPQALLLWLQEGVFGRPLGDDRRGGRVPRPVLFPGQRLHRDREYLHHGAHRPRSCRPSPSTPYARIYEQLFMSFYRQHDVAVPGPVPRCSATPRCCRSR